MDKYSSSLEQESCEVSLARIPLPLFFFKIYLFIYLFSFWDQLRVALAARGSHSSGSSYWGALALGARTSVVTARGLQ